MQNYCYRTKFDFITQSMRQQILTFVQSAGEAAVTSQHDFSRYFPGKTGPGLFTFLQLPQHLEDSICAAIPQYLIRDDLFIRVQITTGTVSQDSANAVECVPPHIDRGRRAGIFFLLTNDDSETRFYDWNNDACQELIQNMVALPHQIHCRLKIRFKQDECWFFNHAALHSIHAVRDQRVSLNICYENLELENLLRIYFQNTNPGD